MALVITGLPKPTTHGAPQLPGQLRSDGLAALRGKARTPVATSNTPRLTVHTSTNSINPITEGTTAVLDEVDVKPTPIFGRSSFPCGFVFGAASSSYQIEGGVEERGVNIWDTFCREFPEKIDGNSNGDIATDSYHRYKEDVELLKDMGMDAYRFSISWPRILRDGTLKGGINDIGVNYYNKLIDALITNGIKPYVTLFHWDLPQALEDQYGGFRDKKIVTDFKDYCEVCYKAFGDRVKHWITLNEPWTFSTLGYGMGLFAPGRCSSSNIPKYNYINCPAGDSLTEPYIVSHNLILAHAAAANLYKEKYQATQKGQIGIILNCKGHTPYNNGYADLQAQERAIDFEFGWFMDPLVTGDYPFNMRALVRDRLPYFEDNESQMIKNSFDFLGLNYYTGIYTKSRRILKDDKPDLYILDLHVEEEETRDGVPIGEKTGTWIYVYPKGLRDLLIYIKSRYHNPPIYITENGLCEVNKNFPLVEALDDPARKNYISVHLNAINEAIREKVNVKGYFHWSLTDNFEWREGYSQRYGINYIDFQDNLKRIPKTSAMWFTKFLKS